MLENKVTTTTTTTTTTRTDTVVISVYIHRSIYVFSFMGLHDSTVSLFDAND